MRQRPKARFPLPFAGSPSIAVRSPFLLFLCHSVFKKHLIAARLLTSNFKEAKMTSSLSRFAMFFTQKKENIWKLLWYYTRGDALLAFWASNIQYYLVL